LYTTYVLATIARTNIQGHPKSMLFISSKRAYIYLLVINSNHGLIFHRFWSSMEIRQLKPNIENCGQIAADGDMVTIDSPIQRHSAYRRSPRPLRLTV